LLAGVLEEGKLLHVAHQFEQAAAVMSCHPAARLIPNAPVLPTTHP
jgi:hypothetical protein